MRETTRKVEKNHRKTSFFESIVECLLSTMINISLSLILVDVMQDWFVLTQNDLIGSILPQFNLNRNVFSFSTIYFAYVPFLKAFGLIVYQMRLNWVKWIRGCSISQNHLTGVTIFGVCARCKSNTNRLNRTIQRT